ncbi:MAG: AI-2E family transporter [Anaerolineae bacterium]|nr:AI-2E family transporter [Anaerolineae bacterium]
MARKPARTEAAKAAVSPALAPDFGLTRDEIIARQALKRQAVFWLAALVFFGLFLWLFSSILLPFIVGMTLAYFLDPVADRLEKAGFSRLMATLFILLSFIVLFIAFLMIVVPVLVTQMADFGAKLPGYIVQLQALASEENLKWLHDSFGIDAASIQRNVGSLLTQAASFSTTILQSIWTSGLSIINVASLFVITPVVAFYTLLDWDRMIARVDSWIPRDNVETVRMIGNDVNNAIAGFIRGQGLVCMILGFMYATGLILVGLNFGLLIGIFAGLISFIPYVGSIIGMVLAGIVAIVQFGTDWLMLAAVAAVFVVGQFIEGNILSPKLVGGSIGLHPVWLMFALLAFGSLFGFVGLLVAVPASAAIGVLVRFAIARYKASPLYHGHAPHRS